MGSDITPDEELSLPPESDELVKSVAAEVLDAESEEAEAEAPEAEPMVITKDLVAAVDALGMSWAAFQLYPDPAKTPAWQRAMDMFADSEAYPVYAEVTPDSFLCDAGPIESVVDGTSRIVRALYVHEVAAVSFPAPPVSAELIKFFEILARETDDVSGAGGVRALLSNAGIGSIEAVNRMALAETEHIVEAGRHPDVLAIVNKVIDANAIAERVQAAGTVDEVTEAFTVWFEDVLGKVDADDVVARESVVVTFAEAFFALSSDDRLGILEYSLASRTKPEFQLLLDQFSGHELASMSGDLSSNSQAELADYARASTDEGRPEELVNMLQSAAEVDEARRAVAGRIAELLDDDSPTVGRGATFARLRSQIAGMPPPLGMGRRVLRDLMSIEERDARFRRILRIWTGKIARSIHASDLEDAQRWLDACLVDPTFPKSRHNEMLDALAAMATDDLIAVLVGHYDEGQIPPIAIRLIEAWGTRVVRKLVDRLAAEEDPGRRRALIDLLGVLGSKDSSGLVEHLNDDRWYVVRNLTIALGKTGRADVAPRLRSLSHAHSDHRVRVEALRALMPVSMTQGVEASIRALGDDHKRVRQAAGALLAAAEGEGVDEALRATLVAKEVPSEIKLRLIDVLSDRETTEARSALEQAAARKALIGGRRAVRQAAQQALKGRQ